MSRRITITIDDDVSDKDAIAAVGEAVARGRVSNNDTQYCYATANRQTQITVFAGLTKNESDTFKVIREQY